MKRVKNWGDALPPEGERGQNFDFAGNSGFSYGNSGFSYGNSKNDIFKHYFGKLTKDEEKLNEIRNILEKYKLEIPNSLRVFRKGSIICEIYDKYLIFTPDLKFITVLDYISSEYKVAIVATGVRKKVKEIFDEIRKILSS